MFFLKGQLSTFVLHDNKKYEIGRLHGDILIKNSSVSRKHAEIEVKNGMAHLRDFNSRYSTRYNGTVLLGNEQIKIENGGKITFGEVAFTLEEAPAIVTCATGFKDDKRELELIINKLGGTYLKDWSDDCTHLTVNEVVLTLKVLHAILDNKKIVAPQYWKKYLQNIKNNELPPDPSDYFPPLAETIINPNCIEYNPDRKTIFLGKKFAFWQKKNQSRMDEIIRKAGGKSVLLTNYTSDIELLSKLLDECIVIDPEDPSIEQKFHKLLKVYFNKGKRLIPKQEIVLAILQCSCEENCNPNFNRAQTVFLKETPKDNNSTPLVKESESQQYEMETDEKPKVILASFDENIYIDTLDQKPSTSNKTLGIIEETQMPAKRIKLDPYIETIGTITEPSAVEDGWTKKKQAPSFKRPNQEITLPPAKKVKDENAWLKSNPFTPLKTVLQEKPFSSIVKQDVDIDLSNNPFSRKVVAVREESNSENREKSKIKTKEEVQTKKNNKKPVKKEESLGDETAPADLSRLAHSITNGTWIDCSVKKQVKLSDDDLDEKERVWCESFNDSVVVVVKDLLRKDKENIDIPTSTGIHSNNVKNFKKFRKVPVPKALTIVKCTKVDVGD